MFPSTVFRPSPAGDGAPALAPVSRVFGYCRVSTLRQASEGESLEVQRRQIEGYAHMHGMAAVDFVVDDGVSGSIPVRERDSGGVMFEALKAGDVVIAAKLDRMFRSALDALEIVETLRERGVRLHLLDLGGDVMGNGLSKLFLTIAAAFAEAERDRIRERILQAKSNQKTNGSFLGGMVPFGWKVDRKGNLKENEDHAKALPMMREMKAAGKSLRAIRDAAREMGVVISHQTVSNVLRRAS